MDKKGRFLGFFRTSFSYKDAALTLSRRRRFKKVSRTKLDRFRKGLLSRTLYAYMTHRCPNHSYSKKVRLQQVELPYRWELVCHKCGYKLTLDKKGYPKC